MALDPQDRGYRRVFRSAQKRVTLWCIVDVMSEERAGGDIKTKVEELFDGIEAAVGDIVSPRTREALTDAIQDVVSAADDHATEDRQRLANLEAQTRVLADAVIAIADTEASVAVAPAVLAVKAEIKSGATPSVTPPRGTYFDGRGTP